MDFLHCFSIYLQTLKPTDNDIPWDTFYREDFQDNFLKESEKAWQPGEGKGTSNGGS